MMRVKSVDDYEFGGKEYVTVWCDNDWGYRFSRLRSDEPYTFDRKIRPNGDRVFNGEPTPKPVVEYMEKWYDCADLHRDRKKSDTTYRWPEG